MTPEQTKTIHDLAFRAREATGRADAYRLITEILNEVERIESAAREEGRLERDDLICAAPRVDREGWNLRFWELAHEWSGAAFGTSDASADKLQAHLALLWRAGETAVPAEAPSPVPLILYCPMCHAQHIDEGEFATKPHHTHACQAPGCPMVWRPAIVPTVGVPFLPGFKNDPQNEPAVPAVRPMTAAESALVGSLLRFHYAEPGAEQTVLDACELILEIRWRPVSEQPSEATRKRGYAVARHENFGVVIIHFSGDRHLLDHHEFNAPGWFYLDIPFDIPEVPR